MVFQTGPTKRTPVTIERARHLRKEQTVTEMLLWRELKDRRFHSLKFRRQSSIGPFIVDFYCAQKKFIIELDGSVHQEQIVKCKDYRRELYLRKNGYRVVRFTNDEVNDRMQDVLRGISEACGISS
ncbi:endonuclease domain-containing protein [Candidatus Peribacteria bacterium]|nr:endonuclease domain-containing protein [Candidatus Peribacteria bacterium]